MTSEAKCQEWNVPTVAVGLLGAAGSGMTSFLLAASAAPHLPGVMSLRPESDTARDRAVHAWTRLARGRFPLRTVVTGPQEHTLLLSCRGVVRARVHLVDHRGDVLHEPESSPEFASFYGGLTTADAIFVTIDGEALGDLVREAQMARPVGRKPDVERPRERLRVHHMCLALRPAAEEQVRRGRVDLLLIVVVTKHDAFRAATADLGDTEALRAATEGLRHVMPILFEAGVTTVLCPVRLGRFAAQSSHPAPDRIAPEGLLAPFVLAAAYESSRHDRRARI